VCVHCGVGCNTIPGERYGLLRRIHNRYNGEVNGYFLCDRGRYGYEFANSDKRIRKPLIRSDESGPQEPTSKAQVLRHLQTVLKDSSGIIGIGSPRASLEANFALRTLVGPERFFANVGCRAPAVPFGHIAGWPARLLAACRQRMLCSCWWTSRTSLPCGPCIAPVCPSKAHGIPKELKCPCGAARQFGRLFSERDHFFIASPATKTDEIATIPSAPRRGPHQFCCS
jgi:hypothetical protein